MTDTKMMLNAKMAELLKGSSKNNQGMEAFLSFVWPKFTVVGDCVFLYDQLENTPARMADFGDETSCEAFVNHVHLNGSEFGNTSSPAETVRSAMRIAELWGIKLSLDFLKDRFMFVISFDEEQSEATLRFHKVRDTQAPWMDKEGIEEYDEPIMVLET